MDQFYSSLGNYLIANISIAKVFIFSFMTGAAFILIPKTYQAFLKWKETKKPTDFSITIFQGALSLLFLASVYPLFLFSVLNMNSIFSFGIYRILVFIALMYFVLYFSLPKTLSYWQRLNIKKTQANFSLMCFYGLISFYCMSVFFILIIDLAISAAR